MQRQDYIERLIQQIAAAVARALGAARNGHPDDAQRELEATWSGVLGLRRGDVDRVDEATLRALLGAKKEPAAALLEAEAEVRQSKGDDVGAARLRALAARLRSSVLNP